MNGYRCPGQDKRFWRPEDVFEAKCPFCGKRIEFWKDDVRLTCERCGNDVPNPRLNLGCAKWCKFAEQCLGARKENVPRQGREGCVNPAVAGGGKDKETHDE